MMVNIILSWIGRIFGRRNKKIYLTPSFPRKKEERYVKKKGCYDNRELSWLKFNERVLNEAGNSKVPLGERLTFASIYQSNLDEFYMVRVGSLTTQMESSEVVRENKTNMTSEEQIRAILDHTRELDAKKGKIYEQMMGELEPHGIRIINFNKLSNEEGEFLERYYDTEIAPFVSPMIIGKQQPFPFLKNKEIYAVVLLQTKSGKRRTGIIPCSNNVFKRLIEIPTRPGNFMLSEELILHFASKIFDKYDIREKTLMRITRNADIDAGALYDEDLDYRDMMEMMIKQRKRLSPVRIELSRKINKKVVDELCGFTDLDKDHVFYSATPLDLSFVFQLQDYLRNKEELFFGKRIPQYSPDLNTKESLLAQIELKDVLLSYPYESIKPFLSMLHEAAEDESVVSIKMTLYRLAKQSKVVEALIEAAENGKEVVVLVELRARFDEESNIEWSRRLEDAGCRVIYGLEKYKVHSKLCLITRKTETGISYITQIGTGNYNEKTARLYTDLSLMTSNVDIGTEAAGVFTALLMGDTVESTEHLLVAPNCLQSKVTAMMDEEIAHAKNGEEAYIGIKMNSLTDKVIIDKLIEASQAGVKIEMVIRGICCLIPGVKGLTENITVVSIVGRFLEHSRIYRFGVKGRDKIYIASADYMTRNTIRRVEVAAPIYDEAIKERLRNMFDIAMKDDEKGKIENAQGVYEDRVLGEVKMNSQEYFYQEAYDRVQK
ncbi:MAG: polyphosphate kinase 1 [Lachnospiraceae bacterium]|nr:polyphosphate kinase 1 [Lachnospiraceae bacterium]MDD3617416.1 polyphosphate kinase 1 [Lachnospiraceae bacterium]